MSKIDKLIQKLLSNSRDLTWDEFKKILAHYGFKEIKTGKTTGSGRKFQNSSGARFNCHAPHQPPIVKQYIISNFKELIGDF